MDASCRPHRDLTVSDLIQRHNKGGKQVLDDNTVFLPNRVYLVRLPWDIELPDHTCARATAKSSTGRLDILARLVADHQPEFDRLGHSAKTNLYLEVVPLTFPIRVAPGLALTQLRFIKGNEGLCTVPCEALKYENVPVLVRRDGHQAELQPAQGDPAGVLLTLDLTRDPVVGCVGFEAKEFTADMEPINPWVREPKEEGQPDFRIAPEKYWEKVEPEHENETVRIKQNRFYIFRSKERFRVPPHLAVECQAYSESLGDIRIHYAGFAHPYFGYEYVDNKWVPRREGTPLIFEVRGFSMDTILRHGAPLAKVFFQRMSSAAAPDDKQVYNEQELQLSACFHSWNNE